MNRLKRSRYGLNLGTISYVSQTLRRWRGNDRAVARRFNGLSRDVGQTLNRVQKVLR